MTFAEFAQMLYPFCGKGNYHSDFVVALVWNIIEDTDDDSCCSFLDKRPDYQAKIYNGRKPFPKKDATCVVGHLDKAKFETYISALSDDAIEGLRTALSDKGIMVSNKYDITSKCADIFAEIMTDCASSTRQRPTSRVKIADPFEALKRVEELLATLPAPTPVEPPKLPLLEEQPYISELYAAYGDKEGIANFKAGHLPQYSEYDEDIKERRIDYFAAESIRRGVSELYSGEYASQFDALKEETFNGIKNTARKTFSNGYDRMLCVMEQAVLIEVKKYLLSRSPNWINNRVKMGVCHFLVNDNRLRWVKK